MLDFALTFPEAYEDHPWGEVVVKVNKKIFVFLGVGDGSYPPGIGMKLPESQHEALAIDGIEPTGYNLGKSGWVSIPLTADVIRSAEPELLREWIDESYRAVALKRLIKILDARTPG